MSTTITPRTRGALLLGVALLAGGVVPLAASADNPNSVPSVIVPLDPARILDTRTGLGVGRAEPLAADQTITLQVAGVAGVPANATGVVLNVTVTGAAGAGYVSAFPTGTAQPNASVINYSPGVDVANMITAMVGAGGAINLFNAQSSAHLVADVAGYLVPGGGAAGPQGPQGAQGPVGPQGPAAPGGVAFDQTLAVPAGGNNMVSPGTVGSYGVQLICNSAGVAAIRFGYTDAFIRITGTSVEGNPDEIVDQVNATGSGSGALGISTPSELTFSGSVVSPTAGALQIELYLFVSGGSCFLRGTVLPV